MANSCANTCPSGYWKNNVTRICTLCNSLCDTCLDGTTTNCQTCKSGAYLILSENKCVTVCPSGTLAVGDPTNECQTCTGNCATCATGLSFCTSCLDGFFL